MNQPVQQNLKDKKLWRRVLYMILFWIAYNIAELVIGAVVILQVIIRLFSGSVNERLRIFGKQLSMYAYSVFLFLTFNSEAMPFPFDDFPKAD